MGTGRCRMSASRTLPGADTPGGGLPCRRFSLKRAPLSKTLRFAILHRDRFTCRYCGKRPPDVVLVIDHIYPVVGGGGTVVENLLTACESCNQGKAARLLQVGPPSLLRKCPASGTRVSKVRQSGARLTVCDICGQTVRCSRQRRLNGHMIPARRTSPDAPPGIPLDRGSSWLG